MRMPRSVRIALATVGLALFPPVTATAQPLGWVQLPNGKYAYQTDYLTSGMFTCSRWIVVGSCFAVGNRVTLTNGGSQVTWTWKPGAGTLQSQFAGTTPLFKFGTLEKTTSGSPNVLLPVMVNPAAYLFRLNVGVALTGVTRSTSNDLAWVFVPNSPQSVRVGGYRSSFIFDYAQHPVDRRTGAVGLFTQVPRGGISADQGELDILAQTSIATPEPVTLVLVGTGLVGVGAAVRRRRR